MNNYILLIVLIAAGCMVICIGIRRYYQAKAENEFYNLLLKLDRAIAGDVQETIYDESMDAAITLRLNRLVQISGMNQERAKKERDFIKALISNISHQIRTPLTNIMLYTGLLKEQTLGKDAELLLDKLMKQSDKLDFFIKELVQSSYLEQEMIAIHPESVNVMEIVNMACQTAELAAIKKEIVIRQEGKDTVCYADKRWTIEAVGNVLDNAVKYSPEKSVVEIKVIPYEAFICIQVADEGMGITEEEQGLVFQRFYRSQNVSEKPGFGIGLYLVREVLSKQGGYVKIKSAYQKGTTVQMFLRYKD